MREFADAAFREAGISLRWEGEGAEERGVVEAVEASVDQKPACRPDDVVVSVDRRYFRPTEVDDLLGDPSKARKQLGWWPKTSFEELVNEMVAEDLSLARRDRLVRDGGFKTYEYNE